MKKLFISFTFIFLALFNICAQTLSDYRAIILVTIDESVPSEFESLIDIVVASTLKERIRKYTDFEIVDVENQDKIFELQAKSEGEAFDANTAIELGKLVNANYAFFIKISFVNNEYIVSADLTDLTTGINTANTLVYKQTIDEIYKNTSCALNEVIVNLCNQIGKPLQEKDIIALLGEPKKAPKKESKPLSRIDTITVQEIEDILFYGEDVDKAEQSLNDLIKRYPDNDYLKDLKVYAISKDGFDNYIHDNPYINDELLANYIVPIDYYLKTGSRKVNTYLSSGEEAFPKNIALEHYSAFVLFKKYLLERNESYLDEIKDIYNNMAEPSSKFERTLKEKTKSFISGNFHHFSTEECEKLDIYEYLANDNGIRVSSDKKSEYKTLEDAIKKLGPGSIIYLQDEEYNIKELEINKEIIVCGNITKRPQINIKYENSIKVNSPCYFNNIAFVQSEPTSKNRKWGVLEEEGLLNLYSNAAFTDCFIEGSYAQGLITKKDGIKLFMDNCYVSKCTMNGIRIKGNDVDAKLYTTSFSLNNFSGLTCDGNNNIYIEKCNSDTNTFNGFDIMDSGVVALNDCTSEYNELEGFSVSDSKNCTISNSTANENNRDGFRINKGATAILTNCHSRRNFGEGYKFIENTECTVSNSDAYQNMNSGFYFDKDAKADLNGCKSTYNLKDGFTFDSNSNITVTDSEASKNNDGFMVSGQSKAILERCKSHYNKRFGFSTSATAKCTISESESYKNKSGFMSLGQSNLKIKGCLGYDNIEVGFGSLETSHIAVETSQSYKNSKSGFLSSGKSNLDVIGCKIYNNKQNGITAFNESVVIIKDSEAFENLLNGIGSYNKSICNISKTSSYKNKNGGVASQGDSMTFIYNCKSYENGYFGFYITDNSICTITDSEAYRNKKSGFNGNKNSQLDITSCKSYENVQGGFLSFDNASVIIKESTSYSNQWNVYKNGESSLSYNGKKQ